MNKKAVLLPAGIGIAGIFLFLNVLTPMMADDYFYACRLDYAADGTLIPVARLQGAAGLLVSQKCIYMAHSGRIPVLTLVQLFSFVPDLVFDLCNTLVFFLLLWQIVRLAAPSTPCRTAFTLLCAGLLLWQCTPAFGQDLLWRTGAVNYLWTMTVTLAFLLYCLSPHPVCSPAAFVLGLASGWSMENQAAAACCLCLGILLFRWLREHRLPRGLVAGAVGQLSGFALLMLAPGNYRRSAGYGQAGLISPQLLTRAVSYTQALWAELGPLIVLSAAMTLLVAVRSPQRSARPLWLLGGAVLCHFSMVLSPSYPLRSMFGTEVFLIAGFLVCLNALDRPGCLLPVVCAALCLSAAASAPPAIADLAQLHDSAAERSRFILEQRALGHDDLTVPILTAGTRFHPLWGDGLSDLMQNPANERNRAMALYYDVDVIRGQPDD